MYMVMITTARSTILGANYGIQISLLLQWTVPQYDRWNYTLSSNILPQSQPLCRLRLFLNCWSLWTGNALVKPSANWSPVETNRTSSNFCATLSLTKWKSISMCLVLAWNTGLAERWVAPRLSHHNLALGGCRIPNSVNNFWTQTISATASALASALYSASVILTRLVVS